MDKETDLPYSQVLIPMFLIGVGDWMPLFYLLLLILLITFSALISGSEIAFFSLLPDQINELERESSESSKKILKLRKKPSKLLATILISNNFVNIALVLVSDMFLKLVIGEQTLYNWGTSLHGLSLFQSFEISTLANIINFTIAVVGTTSILVLFGEIMPKIYANINNLTLARFMAGPLGFLTVLFSPLSNILVNWTDIFKNKIEKKQKTNKGSGKEDIEEALDIAFKEKDQEEDLDILKSIIKFSDVSVKQIMKPRNGVVAIDKDINYHEVLNVIKDSGYSRIPVYEEDFDNLFGILYVKDLIPHLENKEDFEWQNIVRTNILYVPESKKINELLKEFQKLKLHIAIVVDEYGGSSGIVTMEDIMEEILGEIMDEFDEEEEIEYQAIDDKTYLFEGKTSLIDFLKVFNEDISVFDEIKGDSDSLAGLILEVAGELPAKGYEVNTLNYKLIVEEVSDRRIEKILVILSKISNENSK